MDRHAVSGHRIEIQLPETQLPAEVTRSGKLEKKNGSKVDEIRIQGDADDETFL